MGRRTFYIRIIVCWVWNFSWGMWNTDDCSFFLFWFIGFTSLWTNKKIYNFFYSTLFIAAKETGCPQITLQPKEKRAF